MASDGDRSADGESAGSFWSAQGGAPGADAPGDAAQGAAGGAVGSIWSTFGDLFAEGKASSLETLLRQEDCPVELLLEEEDVIQEFKACNQKLLERLCDPEAAVQLMQYVTREAPEEASHARKFRYPFVTVELLTCAPNQFLQVLVKAENSQVMDTLWSFMEADPPADVNPVLAGYFSRAVAAVLSKHPAELAGYLRARGAEALLDRFMERLHLRSLAELFAILACAEAEANLVFPTEGLVKRLLTQFAKPSPGCETQERVTCLIDFMLEKKDAICFADDLLKQLISTDTISFLVDRVFSSESGVVSAACSTLSSIVDHCYVKDQSNASFRASTPLMSPVAPPPPPPDLGDEGVVNVGDDLVNEAAPRSPGSASPSSVGKLGTPSQTYLEAMEGDLMGEICRHFPRICELLDAAIERRATQAMPIGTVPAAGNTCIVVVNLLVMLARTGSATVLDALSKHDLIPRCFELFFRHPWNNLLHNAVLELVTKVLSGVSDAVRPTLLVHLLRERGLLERLVAEMQAEKEHGPPGSARHARVGYMGHLHMLCRKLLDYLVRHTSLNSVFSEVSGWTDTIIPAMHEHSAIVIAELGGGVQEGDRGLATAGAPPALGEMSSTQDDRSGSSEFFLDDPDDFDGAGGPLPSEPAQRQSAEAASWSSEEAMKEPEVLKTLKELHGRNDDSDDEEALEDLERLRRIGWGGLQPSGESQDDNFDPGFDPGSGPVGKDLPAAPPAAAGWAAFAPAAQPPAFQADFGGPAVPPADFQADFGGAAAPAAPPDAGFVADFGGWPGEGAAGGPPAKAAFEADFGAAPMPALAAHDNGFEITKLTPEPQASPAPAAEPAAVPADPPPAAAPQPAAVAPAPVESQEPQVPPPQPMPAPTPAAPAPWPTDPPAGGGEGARPSEPKEPAEPGSFWSAFADEPAAPAAAAAAPPPWPAQDPPAAPQEPARPAAGPPAEAAGQQAPAEAARPSPAPAAASTGGGGGSWTPRPAATAAQDAGPRPATAGSARPRAAVAATGAAPKPTATTPGVTTKTPPSASFAAAASAQPKFGLGAKPAAASAAPLGGAYGAAPGGFGAPGWGLPAHGAAGYAALGPTMGAPAPGCGYGAALPQAAGFQALSAASAPGGFGAFAPAAAAPTPGGFGAFGGPPTAAGPMAGFAAAPASAAPPQTGWADFGSSLATAAPKAPAAGGATGFASFPAQPAPAVAATAPAFAAFGAGLAAPAPAPRPAGTAPLGTENLFSLLGGPPGRPGAAAAAPAQLAAGTPWPTAPSPWDAPAPAALARGQPVSACGAMAGQADAQWPPGWAGAATPQPAPFGAPAGAQAPVPKPAAGKADRSWVAEFDPMA